MRAAGAARSRPAGAELQSIRNQGPLRNSGLTPQSSVSPECSPPGVITKRVKKHRGMRRASGFHLLLDESLAEEELPLGDVATTPGHGETALGRVPSSERD